MLRICDLRVRTCPRILILELGVLSRPVSSSCLTYGRKWWSSATVEKKSGLLFLTQGTGVSKYFNALYRKFVSDRGIQLKDVPETIWQRMRGKPVKDVERDSVLSKTARNALMSMSLLETRASWEEFCHSRTSYTLRKSQQRVWPLIVQFDLRFDARPQQEQVNYSQMRSYNVEVVISPQNGMSGIRDITYKCPCIHSFSSGMSCIQVTSVLANVCMYSYAKDMLRSVVPFQSLSLKT